MAHEHLKGGYQDRRMHWPNSQSWMLVRNVSQVLCDSLHAGHVFQCYCCNYWMSWRVVSNLFNTPWKILVSNICHDQLIFVSPWYFLSQTEFVVSFYFCFWILTLSGINSRFTYGASSFPTKCHLNMSGRQILSEQIDLNPLEQESMVEMNV